MGSDRNKSDLSEIKNILIEQIRYSAEKSKEKEIDIEALKVISEINSTMSTLAYAIMEIDNRQY